MNTNFVSIHFVSSGDSRDEAIVTSDHLRRYAADIFLLLMGVLGPRPQALLRRRFAAEKDRSMIATILRVAGVFLIAVLVFAFSNSAGAEQDIRVMTFN